MSLQRRGFNRVHQDGRTYEFSSPETLLDLDFSQPVYVVVDRLSLDPYIRSRLMDSIEICYREGRGEAVLEFPSDEGGAEPERMVFNERFECKTCGLVYQEPEPRLFSFNNPYGACPRCQGFGNTIDFDIDRVIPDRGKSLSGGAVEPWTKPRYRQIFADMKTYARAHGIPLDVPFRELSSEQQERIIAGDPKENFAGVQGFFQWLERKKYKLHVRVFLEPLSRIRDLPGLRRHAAAARERAVASGTSPSRTREDDQSRRRGSSSGRLSSARRRRRSRRRFWKKLRSGCDSSTKLDSTT